MYVCALSDTYVAMLTLPCAGRRKRKMYVCALSDTYVAVLTLPCADTGRGKCMYVLYPIHMWLCSLFHVRTQEEENVCMCLIRYICSYAHSSMCRKQEEEELQGKVRNIIQEFERTAGV